MFIETALLVMPMAITHAIHTAALARLNAPCKGTGAMIHFTLALHD